MTKNDRFHGICSIIYAFIVGTISIIAGGTALVLAGASFILTGILGVVGFIVTHKEYKQLNKENK